VGKAEFQRGNLTTARDQFLEALEKWPDQENIKPLLEAIAFLWVTQGKHEPASILLSATESWYQRFKFAFTQSEREERENAVACLKQALREEVFTAAWERGRAMALEEAIVYAKQQSRLILNLRMPKKTQKIQIPYSPCKQSVEKN
jgi:tetratricopeptide (TPR) repeat protein